jgi:hypothetical protein
VYKPSFLLPSTNHTNHTHSSYNARHSSMVKPCYLDLLHRARGKPSIVFVPNQKYARRLAVDLLSLSQGMRVRVSVCVSVSACVYAEGKSDGVFVCV